jgi:NitT/TauT family transport system permease protein
VKGSSVLPDAWTYPQHSILSFLRVVLLSFSAVLPPRIAAELAAIVLIFTSQAWNLIFA